MRQFKQQTALVTGAAAGIGRGLCLALCRHGAWVYAAGIGFLVVLIRTWGGLPEGVMYAILLMNALVPFINRATQPRVFGQMTEAPS